MSIIGADASNCLTSNRLQQFKGFISRDQPTGSDNGEISSEDFNAEFVDPGRQNGTHVIPGHAKRLEASFELEPADASVVVPGFKIVVCIGFNCHT